MRDELRIQALDGQWQTLGVDLNPGVMVEDLSVDAAEWGSEQLTGTMKRDPAQPWADLRSFAPIDYRRDGIFGWSGRLLETPMRDGADGRQIGIVAEGWHYHLDDDAIRAVYVHARMGEWINQREWPLTALNQWVGGVQANAESGALVLTLPGGMALPANTLCGVLLDLGPDNTAAHVAMEVDSSNNAAAINFQIQGSADGNPLTSTAIAAAAMNTGATMTFAATPGTPKRFVHVWLYWAAGGTLAADVYARVTGVRVATSTAYMSAGASILKADQVIKHVRAAKLPKLSTDESSIAAGAFSIADLGEPLTWKTPRELMRTAAAFEDNLLQVDADRRLVYQPRPTAPAVVVNGAMVGFEDQSANAGDEVFSRIVAEATGPDGKPLDVQRLASALPGVATSLPDRWGFTRTLIVSTGLNLSSAGLQALVDLMVLARRSTPFRGTCKIGPGAATDPLTGRVIAPVEILKLVDRRIRIADRRDPDTGLLGRDGIIKRVTYTPADDTASVQIDNTRGFLAAIMARLGATTEQVR